MKALALLLLSVALRAQELTADEVRNIVANATAVSPTATVVVVDRPGNPLAVFRNSGSDADVEKALSLARTGAFLSSFGTPLVKAKRLPLRCSCGQS